jgi:NAD(P)-dependent dehydrogenase (short-subunit alcohol dehydrogenase family)
MTDPTNDTIDTTTPDVAVITGGAGGMGLATARKLGADHTIVVSDIDDEKVQAAAGQLTAEGITAYAVPCDITDRASVAALFDTASSHGHVRAVVHAAGVSPQMGDPEFIIRVNGQGTVNITREYLEIAREGDALVNVASIAGHMSPRALQPTRTFARALGDVDAFVTKMVASTKIVPAASRSGMAYSTSKSFVIWYSAHMAADFGKNGARILSVSPGSFDTDMGQLEKDHGSGKMVEYAALKRFGRPEEIAAVLAFAVGREPGYLTGTDILVDGGNRAGLGLRGMLDMARSQ